MIEFLQPFSELITTLVLIVSGCGTLWIATKKIFSKLMTPKLDQLNADITAIKTSSEDQTAKINLLLKNQEDLSVTDKHVLRALITGKYYEYGDKGFLPMYERECLSLLYEDYKGLHGNTFIDGLYTELMALPHDPECILNQ